MSLEEIIVELQARFDLEQKNGAPMRKIIRLWEESPKPTDWDLFNAAAVARKELWKTAIPITEKDIEAWSLLSGLSKFDLFNAIGIRIAEGFHRSEFTFDFCDAVVNKMVIHLYSGFVAGIDNAWAVTFDNIYLAFDAGEYTRPGRDEENPVEVYTRPAIASILEKLQT